MILFSRRWLLKAIAALPLMPRLTSTVDLSRLRAIASHVINAPFVYRWQFRFDKMWGTVSGPFKSLELSDEWTPYRWARRFP